MSDDKLQTFTEFKPLLFSIAYRMLGVVMDAEDMVQETFVRWQRTDQATVDSPKAWLSTVITRLCINQLKSARVQREQYFGEWLPEPIVADSTPSRASDNPLVSESLSLAFLVMLETLSPTERAIFLLREVFEYEFAEIAQIVQKSEQNCRQLLARARKHIAARRPRFETTPQEAEEILQEFDRAVVNGELERLMQLVASDAVLISDGGGKARATLRPVLGSEAISRFLIAVAAKFGSPDQVFRHLPVNGLPGTIAVENDRVIRVTAFGIQHGRIQSLYIITNPDKLRHVLPAPAADR
jgi:RNA polymerase sigma-70 factor (ECF subfamily)